MRREDVDRILSDVLESAERAEVNPGDMSFRVEGDYLAALCRRWLAVEDAKVVTFWSGDRDGEFCVDSPEQADAIQTGQRVRIVPEDGKGVGNG